MNLTYDGLRDEHLWREAGVKLPGYDPRTIAKNTLEQPVWLHFGPGNIFRGYIAALQDTLLEDSLARQGIIAVRSHTDDVLHKIYRAHDNLTLLVTLCADKTAPKSVVASVAATYSAADDFVILQDIFSKQSLQMVSLTITEKGYALRDMAGELLPAVIADAAAGPEHPQHMMAVITALLYTRYRSEGAPIALVSMDNCSRNGERLGNAVRDVAVMWHKNGLVEQGFLDYLCDNARVSFPWSMIDKIVPRPEPGIGKRLMREGIKDMRPLVTGNGSHIAPFVNAEAPQYLVIEDNFPAGRPPLEKAGVYFADRDTVNRAERMKVTACLNPLHTALAIFGCLLGYNRISEEMHDPLLLALVRRLGYTEGLAVVTSPGIIDARAFLDEVLTVRLPNPFVPDTPQRIACDTSQKLPIRFGETIKAYLASPDHDTESLIAIPLVLAAWLRYLLGVDDNLRPMPLSGDPMLGHMQAALANVEMCNPESAKGQLNAILHNSTLFGLDLYEAGLASRVEAMFIRMLAGKGAVRALLKEHLI